MVQGKDLHYKSGDRQKNRTLYVFIQSVHPPSFVSTSSEAALSPEVSRESRLSSSISVISAIGEIKFVFAPKLTGLYQKLTGLYRQPSMRTNAYSANLTQSERVLVCRLSRG